MICGPKMENFASLMDALIKSDGILQLKRDADLIDAFMDWQNDSAKFEAMAERGQAVFAAHQDAIRKTVEALGDDELGDSSAS